jgi:outer membrane protein assembly factor BamD (BamD/ComL family)
MKQPRLGRSIVTAVFLAVVSGCASVPAAPSHASREAPPRPPKTSQEDEYDGWLWKSLTGKRPAAGDAASTAWPADNAAVVPASATQPISTDAPAADAAPAASSVYRPNASQVYPPVAPVAVPQKKKKSIFDPSDLGPEQMYKSMKSVVGMGPDEPLARKSFQEGESLFRERKYDLAAPKFKVAADRWPDSLLEEDALFMLGESYFFCDKYSAAHDTYGILLKKFENSRYLDTVARREFAIGRYWEQMDAKNSQWPITPNFTDKTRPWFDTFGNAVDAYQRVQMHDPNGPLADDARMAMGNAYFARDKHEEAALQYDYLRKEYPQSKHQVHAHVLGLKSTQKTYQGADYDPTPLNNADQIARSALTQFPRELGEEKARVMQMSKDITENKALRDYAMGEYYEGKRCYGAARFYYQNILKEHPLTQTAQKAKERYAAIADKPDAPKNHFRWLTQALGDPE